jgi:hypothetical protein
MIDMAGHTTAKKVQIFRALFTGLPGVYGTYDPRTGRVRQEKAPVTDEVILAHLAGRKPYGVYLLTGDKTGALAVDFDEDELSLPIVFTKVARMHGLPAYIERSKSKGYHVWMFFERGGVPARTARFVAQQILAKIKAPETEIFPKQDALVEGVMYGNFINAPLFGGLVAKGRTVFVDPADPTKTYPDQWQFLENIRRITESQLDFAAKRLAPSFKDEDRESRQVQRNDRYGVGTDQSPFGLPPCARQMLAEGVTCFQRVSCFRLAVHLKRNGIPHDLAAVVLKAWAKRNRPTNGKRIITDREIDYQTRCAFERPYRGFGCEHAAMAAYCHPDCPLHRHAVGGRNGGIDAPAKGRRDGQNGS